MLLVFFSLKYILNSLLPSFFPWQFYWRTKIDKNDQHQYIGKVYLSLPLYFLFFITNSIIYNNNRKLTQMRTMVELVHNSCNIDDKVNPIRTGGGAGIHPPPTGFCPLLKKSAYDPYLKFLDFSQLLVADTPIKFFFRKILFPPSDSTFETRSTKIFFCFLL